jgi:hypothetical protein
MLAMLAPSCSLFHKSSKATAPPPAPAPSQPAAKPAPKPEENVALPAPPQISPQKPDLTKQPPSQPAAGKLPPRPRDRRGSRAHGQPQPQENAATGQQAPAQQPAAASPTPAQPQAPEEGAAAEVPELEQILTPQQRQAYIEEIDSNVGRAQKTVETLQGRHLDGDQKVYLDRVRAFIDQAREARKTDLFRAKNLSERASVLAEDLMRSVQ